MTGSPTPAIPRAAATILVLRDDPFEVLMVRRHGNGPFASALVFPGGLVDPSDRDEAWTPLIEGAHGSDRDECALRIAACRETYEEASLLLACGASLPTGHDGIFRDVVRASGGRLRLGDLTRFGHWITPETAPERFDTHFFLARARRAGGGVRRRRDRRA